MLIPSLIQPNVQNTLNLLSTKETKRFRFMIITMSYCLLAKLMPPDLSVYFVYLHIYVCVCPSACLLR